MMFFEIAFGLYFLVLSGTSGFLAENLYHLQGNTHFSMPPSEYTLLPAHWPKAFLGNRCALQPPGTGCEAPSAGLL